jgi:hypothetical protein
MRRIRSVVYAGLMCGPRPLADAVTASAGAAGSAGASPSATSSTPGRHGDGHCHRMRGQQEFSGQRPAAGDAEDVTGDVAGFLRGEEDVRPGEFGGLPGAAERGSARRTIPLNGWASTAYGELSWARNAPRP